MPRTPKSPTTFSSKPYETCWNVSTPPISEEQNQTIAFAPNMTADSFHSLETDGSLSFISSTPSDLLFPAPLVDDYETLSKAKPHHGKKRSNNHIPRPPNAFILFRSSFIKQQHIPGTIEGNHSQLSKIVGACWQRLSFEERQVWQDRARAVRAEHKKKYPDYRFVRGGVPGGGGGGGSSGEEVTTKKPERKKIPKFVNTTADEDGKTKTFTVTSKSESNEPSSPTKSRSKRTLPPRPFEDPRRCEQIARLLVAGHKGEKLEELVRKFDDENGFGASAFFNRKDSLKLTEIQTPQSRELEAAGLGRRSSSCPPVPQQLLPTAQSAFPTPSSPPAARKPKALRATTSMPLGASATEPFFDVSQAGQSPYPERNWRRRSARSASPPSSATLTRFPPNFDFGHSQAVDSSHPFFGGFSFETAESRAPEQSAVMSPISPLEQEQDHADNAFFMSWNHSAQSLPDFNSQNSQIAIPTLHPSLKIETALTSLSASASSSSLSSYAPSPSPLTAQSNYLSPYLGVPFDSDSGPSAESSSPGPSTPSYSDDDFSVPRSPTAPLSATEENPNLENLEMDIHLGLAHMHMGVLDSIPQPPVSDSSLLDYMQFYEPNTSMSHGSRDALMNYTKGLHLCAPTSTSGPASPVPDAPMSVGMNGDESMDYMSDMPGFTSEMLKELGVEAYQPSLTGLQMLSSPLPTPTQDSFHFNY